MKKKRQIKNIYIIIGCLLGLLGTAGIAFHLPHKSQQQAPKPALIKKVESSAQDREKRLESDYLAQQIPPEIAKLSAFIERLEDDIKTFTKALAKTAQESDKIAINKEISDRDLCIMATLKESSNLLKKYHEKALKTKNINLFKLITILQSCSFLFERSH